MNFRNLGAVALAVVLCQTPAAFGTAAVSAAPPKTDDAAHAVDASAKRKGFNVVKRHRRGRAQMCRYTLNGYRYIYTRANSRKARKRLTYRLQIGEWDPYHKRWEPAYPARKRLTLKRGKVRHMHQAGGPLRPRVRVQIRSRNSRSNWSGWRKYRGLKNCPKWYVSRH